MAQNKPRIIKNFEKLSLEIQEQIKLSYPEGFSQNLIQFKNKDNETVSALPFETEDEIYLIKMSVKTAKEIITDDEDYDEDGLLKEEIHDEYKDKYTDADSVSDEDSEIYSDNDSYEFCD